MSSRTSPPTSTDAGPRSPEPGHSERGGGFTVDELAAAAGLTVRTTRYYAGLGLLPPPRRRGRVAYYGELHLAHLELVRALQDHGFTLAAVEGYLRRLPEDADVEDLALQRAMLTSWGGRSTPMTRPELVARAGRELDDATIGRLETIFALRREGEHFVPLPAFDVALQMIELDLPFDSVEHAAEAIDRHMNQLADELTAILRDRVLKPFRDRAPAGSDKAALQETVSRLRQLTLGAVVAGYQRAANEVITRSLSRATRDQD